MENTGETPLPFIRNLFRQEGDSQRSEAGRQGFCAPWQSENSPTRQHHLWVHLANSEMHMALKTN